MRKLFHIGGGALLLAAYLWLQKDSATVAYGVLFSLAVAFDLSRLAFPAFNALILRHLGNVLREEERQSFTAMPHFTLGVFLTSLFYQPAVTKASLLFLTFGDVSATLIGQRFGRIRIGRKSLEGSAAFLIAGTVAGVVFWTLHDLRFWTVFAGAFAGAVAELLSLRINDNLTIPVVTGAVMTLFL